MPIVRHFLLKVDVPAAARKLLGRLVSGDEADAPQITTARDWHVGFEPGPGDNPAEPPRCKPDYCLNLGITWPGLLALEVKDRVPNLSFKSFNAFVAGAAARAELVGDTGDNGPQNWIGGFGTGSDHVMLTLHAANPEALKTYSDRLSALLVEDHAFQEIWRGDGMALMEMQDGKPVPVPKVHFGYVDGISMTTIRGGPGALQARSPAAVRALVVRPAGRGRELLRAGASGTGSQWQLRRLQDDPDRCRRLREFPCSRTRSGSIRSCSPPRCADGGATAFRSRSPRTPTAPRVESRRSN